MLPTIRTYELDSATDAQWNCRQYHIRHQAPELLWTCQAALRQRFTTLHINKYIISFASTPCPISCVDLAIPGSDDVGDRRVVQVGNGVHEGNHRILTSADEFVVAQSRLNHVTQNLVYTAQMGEH